MPERRPPKEPAQTNHLGSLNPLHCEQGRVGRHMSSIRTEREPIGERELNRSLLAACVLGSSTRDVFQTAATGRAAGVLRRLVASAHDRFSRVRSRPQRAGG